MGIYMVSILLNQYLKTNNKSIRRFIGGNMHIGNGCNHIYVIFAVKKYLAILKYVMSYFWVVEQKNMVITLCKTPNKCLKTLLSLL